MATFPFYRDVPPPAQPAEDDLTQVGWVYIGILGKVVKIGWTGLDPEARCRKQSLTYLGSWPGCRKNETDLHHFWAHLRAPGTTEFYDADARMVRWICTMRARRAGPEFAAEQDRPDLWDDAA